jgi:hypothetical protein
MLSFHFSDYILDDESFIHKNAWLEIYPFTNRLIITGINISPGDRMFAFIQEIAPGIWKFSITDTTKG